MRYPLDNWDQLRRGYRFGVPTSYNSHHLGVDYVVPVGTPVYAPSDGTVLAATSGPEAGNRIEFRDTNGRYIRFLHLSAFKHLTGPAKQGDLLALSGNTGTQTSGPHCHIDVSTVYPVNINVFANFIDPDNYFKEHMGTTYDNCVIRHRTLGLFAYVKGGKKQEFNNSNGAVAIMTLLDRLPSMTYVQDFVKNVDGIVWDMIPNVGPGEVFFPSMK